MQLPFDFGLGQSFLASALQSLFGLVAQLFSFLWNNLVFVANSLFQLQLNHIAWNFNLFGTLGRFFRNLWNGLIKSGLLKLWNLVRTLHGKLTFWIDKLSRWLIRIRQIIEHWYFKIFGPYLKLIGTLRKILVLFRSLHIKWAQKLDERLARTEAKLARPLLIITQKLNEVISTLQVILDIDGRIRGGVLLSTIQDVLDQITVLIFGKPLRDLTPDEVGDEIEAKDRASVKQIAARAESRTANGFLTSDRVLYKQSRASVRDAFEVSNDTLGRTSWD